jgi:hypothetical protein
MEISLQRRRFSLMEIYNEIIEEAFDFDNIATYKLNPNDEGWEFDAVLDTEIEKIYIYFEPVRYSRIKIAPKIEKMFNYDLDVYNFGFEISELRVGNQFKKTSYRDYIKILATVGSALNKFINEKSPDIITFFSESKHGGKASDIQKDDIYFKAIDRNTPNGYALDKVKDIIDNKIGLMLYKNDR